MVPFHFLMGVTLVCSTLMISCASSWLCMWVAFEINTLSFMPVMKSKGASKYFLAQSLGSALVLAGAVFNLEVLVMVGAMVKAGVAPVHAWLPQVMEGLSWNLCLLLSTWQKIGPMMVIFSLSSEKALIFFAVCSLMMGALGAIKQSRLRSLVAYSAITHMGWVMSGASVSVSVGLVYFILYCVTSGFLMYKLSASNLNSSVGKDLSLMLALLSMSGLPPFIGFFPKMWVLFNSPLVLCGVLALSSVVMMLVYASVMLSSKGKIYGSGVGATAFFMFFGACLIF